MSELKNLPPQNIEAEEFFLCACLIDNNVIHRSKIHADDFYKSQHGKIWSAMKAVAQAGDPVDVLTVVNKLSSDDKAASILSTINMVYPTAANWKAHERLIVGAAQRRKIIRIASDMMSRVYDESVDKVLHDFRMQLSGVTKHEAAGIVEYKDILLQTFDIIEKRFQSDKISGITTGFRDIDDITDGWQDTELIVLAGRPGHGKTAFSKASVTAAVKENIPCGMIHLEMGESQLGIRALSSRTGIPISRLRRGKLRDNEWIALSHALGFLVELPLYLQFSAYTDREMAQTIDDMVFDKGCKAIWIDYLQLATSEDNSKNREQEVSGISRMLKLKAKEHSIPIIALAQLNRLCETRQDKRPMISDLRESGAIEQDADVIAFIYNDEKYNPKTVDKGITEVIFRKGRQIALDTIKLQWDGATTTFRDLIKTEPRNDHYTEN